MDSLNERLANLGRAVAEVNEPDQDAIADARRRWTRSSRRTRSRRWAFVVAPAFAIAAAVIAIVVTGPSRDEHSLTYAIGDTPGERGQWIAAREPVQLRFSDGSRIDVAQDAKIRVSETNSRGSTLDLEQGALHAAVTHHESSSWRFRTGPYTVFVKGTRFDAAWDAVHERFTLDMQEGKVEVTGPLIPAPVTVSAGQSIIANVREKRFEIRSVRTADATVPATGAGAQPMPVPSSSATSPAASANASTPQPPPNKSRSTTAAPQATTISPAKGAQPGQTESSAAKNLTTPASTEKWRQYLAARAYSSAIAAAEQRGFDAVLADATNAELYALSDAARYAGKLTRAREAVIALRARGEQGKTAFLLGRIASDQGDGAAAIDWFDRYLQEQPSGPFAETATGRLIELYKSRDAGRAAKLAERYLVAYPDGSYAALARTLVEK